MRIIRGWVWEAAPACDRRSVGNRNDSDAAETPGIPISAKPTEDKPSYFLSAPPVAPFTTTSSWEKVCVGKVTSWPGSP